MDVVARETQVPAHEREAWRRVFLATKTHGGLRETPCGSIPARRNCWHLAHKADGSLSDELGYLLGAAHERCDFGASGDVPPRAVGKAVSVLHKEWDFLVLNRDDSLTFCFFQ